MEVLELLVEISELASGGGLQKRDGLGQFVVALMQLTLKLSFYELEFFSDVPPKGCESAPS